MGPEDHIVRRFALGLASFTIILISNTAWGIDRKGGAVCVVGEERREIPPESSLPPMPLVQAYRAPEPRPDGYVEVRTPDGNTCPARVRYELDGDVLQEWTLPTGAGIVSFSGETERRVERDCSSANLDYEAVGLDDSRFTFSRTSGDCETVLDGHYVAECTRGRYRGFLGGLSPQGFDFDAHPVFYASGDPDVDDGTIVLETALEDGRHTPADAFILSAESGKPVRFVSLLTGEGQATLDHGPYDVVIMNRNRTVRGRAPINSRSGHTQRFRIRLDERMPLLARIVEPQITPSDFPQAAGHLCNRNNVFVDYGGTLTIRGVDFPFASRTTVSKGAFTLSGLKRGTYLLQFFTEDFHAERLIDIPLPVFMNGSEVLDRGTFEQLNDRYPRH